MCTSRWLVSSQVLSLSKALYWDRNESSRELSKRFYERTKPMPAMGQACVYSCVMHYLEAVRQAGTTDTTTVRKKMGEIKVNDMFAENAYTREDGRLMNEIGSESSREREWQYV